MQRKIRKALALVVIFGCFLFITTLFASPHVSFAQDSERPSDPPADSGKPPQNGPPDSQTNSVTLTNPLCPPTNENCETSTIAGLVYGLLNWLKNLATPVAVGFIMYGAFQMMFAAGNETKYKAGKKTVWYTVVGYAIILLGWGISEIISNLIAGNF